LEALIRASREGRLHAQVRVVVSNRAEAPGLARAREAGIETVVLPHGDYDTRDRYDLALIDALRARGVALVCLAFPGLTPSARPSSTA
jgi:phosphoribosylglycinamide formyltransferase-1